MAITRQELAPFPIFDGLTAEQVDKILAIVGEQRVAAGESIIREGEIGDALYLLLDGRVEVRKNLTLNLGHGGLDAREKSLVALRADQAPYFGEMALLKADSLRTATVQAVAECRVGVLHHDAFTRLCESDTALGYKVLLNIAKTLVVHLERTNQDVLKLTTAFSLALQS
ncbi:MAG TPA: cyclic nucleotide-binding domain-containing protein [bacterium]|nr:cyclic nucleotide-binding domain-containing protein [bacterium]HQG44034.1 cyclic nucleotide-binding domain-containing protein [bacterium]HQI48148.1 cyclic nucleotide-binding domain-containing protein [bacterium]HQJ65691.1 cyclic nucleotide-binding domain-containing protein [bacterium]